MARRRTLEAPSRGARRSSGVGVSVGIVDAVRVAVGDEVGDDVGLNVGVVTGVSVWVGVAVRVEVGRIPSRRTKISWLAGVAPGSGPSQATALCPFSTRPTRG
jgi:hypothetical protein